MVYIKVKGWADQGDGKIKVHYFTWDGKCICTKQQHSDIIDAPLVSDYEKRDVHLEILKQVFKK